MNDILKNIFNSNPTFYILDLRPPNALELVILYIVFRTHNGFIWLYGYKMYFFQNGWCLLKLYSLAVKSKYQNINALMVLGLIIEEPVSTYQLTA